MLYSKYKNVIQPSICDSSHRQFVIVDRQFVIVDRQFVIVNFQKT